MQKISKSVDISRVVYIYIYIYIYIYLYFTIKCCPVNGHRHTDIHTDAQHLIVHPVRCRRATITRCRKPTTGDILNVFPLVASALSGMSVVINRRH